MLTEVQQQIEPFSTRSPERADGALIILAALLAASGCAALVYEIVWLQLLQLVIGSSAVSLGLLLAAYMGGLCLGSALLPRLVSAQHHPLKLYGWIEIGIAVLGVAALFGVPLVGRVYVAGASQGTVGLLLRGLVAAICLLPPTLLMGGSLPAISRWVGVSPRGVARLGYLYSANIAGAVLGCLLAGFYLLRVYDMRVATFAAVGINVAAAAVSFALASRIPKSAPDAEVAHGAVRGSRLIYVVTALSGLCALGAEVVWTRLLSLLLGGTTYTFSIILAVFLVGLWGGSSFGSALARRLKHPRLALAGFQLLLAMAIGWTAYTLSNSLPFWPVDPWLSRDPWFNFELDLARCTWAILPATLLWGASFPLALASAAGPGVDPARLSGEVYAANTAGSIIGSLAFSLFLIPGMGTRESQQLLIALSLLTAVIAALSAGPVLRAKPIRTAVVGLAGLVIGVLLIGSVIDVPWQVVAYGRRIAPMVRAYDLFDQANPTTVLFRGEGINSSVLIAERAGQRHFYVSGKAEASTAILDMRLERLMGHLPGLIHPDPKSVLIVGFGAGVTAGSFVPYPDVKQIVICELEPFIPPASTEYFGDQNNRVKNDPRTRIIFDDARHYMFTAREKYDVITTDPIHPWVKGTSTLYSKEYYQLVKERLNPGGVVAQWLPIYDSDPETIRTELATFFEVFPQGTVWSNNYKGDGYDLVLVGQAEPGPVNVDKLQARLDQPSYAPVSQSLKDVGFYSAVDFLATYAGRAQDLRPMLQGAQINDDISQRLQYIAGLGLNSMAFKDIYQDILRHRRFPPDFLTGEGARLDALKTLLPPVR